MLQARAHRADFRGTTSGEHAAWLRQILTRHQANALRDGRDVRRKFSLEQAVEASSARLEAFLASPEAGPNDRAERTEQALRLTEALARLPES